MTGHNVTVLCSLYVRGETYSEQKKKKKKTETQVKIKESPT